MRDDEAETAVEAKFKGKNGEELNKFYRRFADLEKEMKLLKRGGHEELEKEKYRMLIAEYRKFKTNEIGTLKYSGSSPIKVTRCCQRLVLIVPVEELSHSGRALFQRIYFSFVTLKCLLIVKTIYFCDTEMFRVAWLIYII